MSILVVMVLVYCLHVLLKLNWLSTVFVLFYLQIMRTFHMKREAEREMQISRFEEACLYMDTILYAFVKEGKIYQTMENAINTLEEGDLKKCIEEAVDYMRLTFDDVAVIERGLDKIYSAYSCKRIKNIQNFMLHVEYYGGDVGPSVALLTKDKNRWSRRINQTIADRAKMFREIVLSVVVSLIICGVILYLPVMKIDISNNLIVQLLTLAVIVVDDLIILKAQKCLCVDYLSVDDLDEDDYYAKKLKAYEEYDESKDKRLSVALAFLALMPGGYGIWKDNAGIIAISLVLFLICINQHKIGRKLATKGLISYIKSAFPVWLMDLALLLESENVYISLVRSKEHVPKILGFNLDKLIGQIEIDPESSKPYHDFLCDFKLPEIHSALGLLYSISAGNSADYGKQLDELISRNLELLDMAEKDRLRKKAGNMYILFLAPVLTASIKLVVDMSVFLLSFLSWSVI